VWEPPASLWPNNGSRRVSAGKIRVTEKTPGGTTGFRGWISCLGEVHQKLRFLSSELVFNLALGGQLGLGPLFGDPWRTTGTPLTDPLEEQPFHHRMTCPGCPPPLQNTNTYKNQTSNIMSNIWKVFVVILRIVRNIEIAKHIQQLCGRIPRAYTCTHNSLHFNKILQHSRPQTKAKIRRPSKKLLLLLDQWVREILAFERLANILQEKKVWEHPGDLFFLFCLKCRSLQMCVGAPSLPLAQ
jgi:hypothetical protein